jgi:hypothetical protein
MGPAKFAPLEPGKVLLFVGQDNASIMEYMDHFHGGRLFHRTPRSSPPMPGITAYTALCHDPSKSLNGLSRSIPNTTCPVVFGAGPVDLSALLERFPDAPLNIGLEMTGANLAEVGEGTYAGTLDRMADYFNGPEICRRPVFLRIGYEMDGPWNGYAPGPYQAAFRRIVTHLRERKVANVVSVWHGATSRHTNGVDVGSWWPGEDVVDYCGMSFFEFDAQAWGNMAGIARKWGKPVMICEAAPQGFDVVKKTQACCTGDGRDRRQISERAVWDDWFKGYFSFIRSELDLIRVVSVGPPPRPRVFLCRLLSFRRWHTDSRPFALLIVHQLPVERSGHVE